MVRKVSWGKLRQVRGLLALLIVLAVCFGDRVARGQDGEALELPEIVNLVFTNSPYAFFKGVELPSDPSDAWQKPGFDDSAWFQELFTPFSYGESLDFGTILEDMQDNYTTFLLRHSFVVQNPEEITELVVNAAIDDGFIAWINGHEILRVNVPDQPFGIGYTASTVPEPVPYIRYEVEIDDDVLLFGDNVLGVQVVNGNIASSDIFFEISLDGVIGVVEDLPHLPSLDPSKEPIIEGVFDLGSEWRFFRGTTDPSNPIDSWRQPDFNDTAWELGRSPLFYGEDVEGGTLIEGMSGIYTSVYLRRSFMVEESQLNRGVEVSALIDDGLAVWINGRELGRAGVDRGDLPFDSNANISAEEPLQPTLLRGPTDLLLLGENWIAVQALNGSAFSSDFFVDLKLGVVDAPVIPKRAEWLFFSGNVDPNTESATRWQEINYDTAEWSVGEAPFVNVRRRGEGTVVSGMLGHFGSLFLRKNIYLDNPALIDAFEIQFQFAHGAAVWLNGTEIFRENLATIELALDALALRSLDEPFERERSISIPSTLLLRGENVLAVRAVNSDLEQPDFIFDLSLDVEGLDATTPALVEIDPPRGAVSELSEIRLVFNEDVFGIAASDLIVNGIPSLQVIRDGREFNFLIDEPSIWPAVVVFEPGGRVLDLAPVPNFFPFDQTEWAYQKEDFDAPKLIEIFPIPGSQVKEFGELELQFDEPVIGLTSDRIRANGVSASSLVETGPGRFRVRFDVLNSLEIILDVVDEEAISDGAGNQLQLLDPWSYEVPVDAPTVSVNELVSASFSGLADEDGGFEDWIELYNEGDSTVDLRGWSLTDDLAVPRKWLFPEIEIASKEYMVLFASGKDRRDSSASLHTNFKLGRGGDAVYVFRPDLPVVVESQSPDPLPELRNGVSFGRAPDGEWRFFATPSPGEANGGSDLSGVTSPVLFNVSHGLFESPFHLTLSSKDPGTVIRYTIDGSEPDEENGNAYTQPILINQSTIVRAAAFRSRALPSMIRSESFLFSGAELRGDLPVFSLATDETNILGPTGILGISGGEYILRGTVLEWSAIDPEDYHNPTKRGFQWERPVSIEYFDQTGDGFQMDGGFRVHGSVSARPKLRDDSKFGFRLYFRSDYDESDVNFPVIEEAVGNSFDRIVLRSGHNDFENPFISDELMRRLVRTGT